MAMRHHWAAFAYFSSQVEHVWLEKYFDEPKHMNKEITT